MANILNRSLFYQIFIVVSSGDNFELDDEAVYKVTVGRPQLGICDYLIVVRLIMIIFALMFPTFAV